MNHDQQFDTRITEELDQRVQALDGATLSKLRQARAHAVEQGSRRRHHWLTTWLPTAGVLAAATLVAVNVWYVQPQDLAAPDPALLESLALESSPAPVEELEFYEWLARIEARLAQPPQAGLLTAGRRWQDAWQTLRQGFEIFPGRTPPASQGVVQAPQQQSPQLRQGPIAF